MPTHEHDALVGLFREDPALAARLAHLMGIRVPGFAQARLVTGDPGHEFDVALVVLLEDSAGIPRLAILVDVQLEKNGYKQYTWPLDLAVCFARFTCPTVLFVIAPDPAIAHWCARPIDLDRRGGVLIPLVVRGQRIPAAIDTEAIVHDPQLAVLSAALHASGELRGLILAAAVDGIETLAAKDPERARRYADNLLAVLPENAREPLQAMIKTKLPTSSSAN